MVWAIKFGLQSHAALQIERGQIQRCHFTMPVLQMQGAVAVLQQLKSLTKLKPPDRQRQSMC